MSTKTIRISKEYLKVVKMWGGYYQLTDSQVVKMFIRLGMLFVEKENNVAHASPQFKQLSAKRELLQELFDDAKKMLTSSKQDYEGTDRELDDMLEELVKLSK